MRIKGSEVTRRDVEVDVDAVETLSQMRSIVLRSLGCRSDAFIDLRGFLVYDEEHYHGSDTRIVLSEHPEENLVKTMKAFEHIHAMLIRD